VQKKYRVRTGPGSATEYLQQLGVPIGNESLRDMATRDAGPHYAILNGRAVYTDADLIAWVEKETVKPARLQGAA